MHRLLWVAVANSTIKIPSGTSNQLKAALRVSVSVQYLHARQGDPSQAKEPQLRSYKGCGTIVSKTDPQPSGPVHSATEATWMG